MICCAEGTVSLYMALPVQILGTETLHLHTDYTLDHWGDISRSSGKFKSDMRDVQVEKANDA